MVPKPHLFEGNDRQGCEGFKQFAGAEQEIGIARLAEALVAPRECLVDQHSTRREGAGNRREQWAVQVIGNDDSIILSTELPKVVGREVGTSQDGPANANSAVVSRSTAHTANPQSRSRRTCRPSPAARSSTRPPGLISGKKRLTQTEGAVEG